MPRGFTPAIYVADDDSAWRLQVDADAVLDVHRGWETDGALDLPPLPRGWLPRRVVALDSHGTQQHARIGRVDADLWTGIQTTFEVMLSDGTTDTAVVVALQGETRLV